MIPSLRTLAIGVILLSLPTTGFAQEEKKGAPPVFAELDLAAAKERAQAEGKLLLLDAMTSWCGPCKVMDRTTWIDPELVGWMEEHVVAIQLDMDEHRPLVKELGIRAYPTVLVFRDGEVADRSVGLRPARWVLAWLKGLEKGETLAERALARFQELKAAGLHKASFAERVEVLSELVEHGHREPALEMLLLLDREAEQLEPGPRARARRRLRPALGALWRTLAPARARIQGLIRSCAPGRPDEALDRYLHLLTATGQRAEIVLWARDSLGSERGRAALREHGGSVRPFLLLDQAWEEAGATLAAPVEAARAKLTWEERREKSGVLPMLRPSRAPSDLTLEERIDRQMVDEVAEMHALLLAAGREEEAREVRSLLLDARTGGRAPTVLVAEMIAKGAYRRELATRLLELARTR